MNVPPGPPPTPWPLSGKREVVDRAACSEISGTSSALETAPEPPVSGSFADSASVVPDGGGMPVGPELSSLLSVSNSTAEGFEGAVDGLALEALAFWAASWPAWRMAAVSGDSVDLYGEGFAGLLTRGEGLEAVLVVGGLEGVFVVDGDGVAGAGWSPPTFALSSPYSFHSSISSKSCCSQVRKGLPRRKMLAIGTPTIIPILTSPGSFFLPARRPHSIRAFSSVATSRAWNGILLALRIVSRREVAVMMCDEPAVRDVYR